MLESSSGNIFSFIEKGLIVCDGSLLTEAPMKRLGQTGIIREGLMPILKNCDDLHARGITSNLNGHFEIKFTLKSIMIRTPSGSSCTYGEVRRGKDSQANSPPCSAVHEILQAKLLEWVAMPSSRGSSNPGLLCFLHWQAGSLPLMKPK